MVKRYGERTAVDGLSLTAGRGEVTAILGPNGAGKTSTIETCEGYRRADGGIVRVLGLGSIADGYKLRPKSASYSSPGASTRMSPSLSTCLHSRFHARPIDYG